MFNISLKYEDNPILHTSSRCKTQDQHLPYKRSPCSTRRILQQMAVTTSTIMAITIILQQSTSSPSTSTMTNNDNHCVCVFGGNLEVYIYRNVSSFEHWDVYKNYWWVRAYVPWRDCFLSWKVIVLVETSFFPSCLPSKGWVHFCFVNTFSLAKYSGIMRSEA